MKEFTKFFREQIERIRVLWPGCDYDHRGLIPVGCPDKWQSDDMAHRYAAFKYMVAQVLKPLTIVEIGVGFGIAANAFLAGSNRPEASYLGFDNGSMDARLLTFVRQQALQGAVCADWRIIETGSETLSSLPACDLCHVDGCHDFSHAYHDVSMALRAARWVLVDDCHDSQVAAATLQALYGRWPGDTNWCFFENSYGGDILIYTGE